MNKQLFAPLQGEKRPLLVAELSGNHEGSLERALYLMQLAAANGADAVKIQTYTADSLTIDCARAEFQIHGGLWDGYSQYSLYDHAKTPPQWLPDLFACAREHRIFLFSSPFAPKDVEALEKVDCPAYKIASFELSYRDLLAACAQTGKPLIISTGLADAKEISRTVDFVRAKGCMDLTLLACVSQYPAPPESFNLRAIPYLQQTFGCAAGLSSHSLNLDIDIAASALGAALIEKHFTDDRQRGSVDAAFSLEPAEWRQLAARTRIVATALGQAQIVLTQADQDLRNYRRSIYLVKSLKPGEVLTKAHTKAVRPGWGLDPFLLEDLIGKRARRALSAPCPLMLEDFE